MSYVSAAGASGLHLYLDPFLPRLCNASTPPAAATATGALAAMGVGAVCVALLLLAEGCRRYGGATSHNSEALPKLSLSANALPLPLMMAQPKTRRLQSLTTTT